MTFEFVSDDNVESLGKSLKRVRQDKELLLADIANDIKIHEKYLAAIEAGDDTFPDHVFKELFVKAYAEYLGVSLDDLLTRLPEAPTPAAEVAKSTPRPTKTPEVVVRPTPVANYRSEESRRGGGKSFLVVGLVIVIVVLGLFLIKLTFDSHPPSKVVIPEAIPKSVPKQPAVDSTEMMADSTDSSAVSDSAAVDSTAAIAPPDSIMLLMIGKGRSWMHVRRDADTSIFKGMIRVNDTLWFSMQDSIFLRFGRGNAVDLYLNALPLKIADSSDTSVVSLWISRDNYLKYVDSSRLAP